MYGYEKTLSKIITTYFPAFDAEDEFGKQFRWVLIACCKIKVGTT